jgi:HK97 gp10 family phage protein
MSKVDIKFEGYLELKEVFQTLTENFGPKDSMSILRKSVGQSLKPVLAKAKSLVPKDTGALSASLQIESRKPTRKDRRSKYVQIGDSVIGVVTTAPGSKLAKTKFLNQKTGSKQVGVPSDARAIAVEFGTAKMAGTPFMRPALESESEAVLGDLSGLLRQNIEKFKSKKI